ncbi:S-layer protein [Chroococcidiopsidales cyanobacterium LEGE 13417]|nr:S-layer protein [Chroococcidiopsidales cyanobacterium LEGE 13417]
MTIKNIAIALLLFTSFVMPVKAQTQPSESKSPLNSPTQTTPSAPNQVTEACIQNRAETLPSPFTDVPRNHWAFKAVMTMHYCGAFRQAASPELFERTTPVQDR